MLPRFLAAEVLFRQRNDGLPLLLPAWSVPLFCIVWCASVPPRLRLSNRHSWNRCCLSSCTCLSMSRQCSTAFILAHMQVTPIWAVPPLRVRHPVLSLSSETTVTADRVCQCSSGLLAMSPWLLCHLNSAVVRRRLALFHAHRSLTCSVLRPECLVTPSTTEATDTLRWAVYFL